MVSGFSDYCSPVGMANENCRSVLRCKNSLGNCYVVLQRYCRILDDADAVAISLQDLVDALPASAIHKATMDENDVLHGSTPPSFDDAAYIGGLAFGPCNWPWAFGPNVSECNEGSVNLSTQRQNPCFADYRPHGSDLMQACRD